MRSLLFWALTDVFDRCELLKFTEFLLSQTTNYSFALIPALSLLPAKDSVNMAYCKPRRYCPILNCVNYSGTTTESGVAFFQYETLSRWFSLISILSVIFILTSFPFSGHRDRPSGDRDRPMRKIRKFETNGSKVFDRIKSTMPQVYRFSSVNCTSIQNVLWKEKMAWNWSRGLYRPFSPNELGLSAIMNENSLLNNIEHISQNWQANWKPGPNRHITEFRHRKLHHQSRIKSSRAKGADSQQKAKPVSVPGRFGWNHNSCISFTADWT